MYTFTNKTKIKVAILFSVSEHESLEREIDCKVTDYRTLLVERKTYEN